MPRAVVSLSVPFLGSVSLISFPPAASAASTRMCRVASILLSSDLYLSSPVKCLA